MTVQIKASFAKDKRHLDGLDHHRKELIDEPLRPRVAIIVFNVTDINHNVLEGTDTPKIGLQQVEVMEGADAIKAIDMMNSTFTRRTGREDSQASLFDDWPGPNGGDVSELAEQAAEAVERLDARRASEAVALDDAPEDGTDSGRSIAEIEQNRADEDGLPWDPEGGAGQGQQEPPWPGDVAYVGESGPELTDLPGPPVPAAEFQAADEDPPADEPPAPTRRRRK